MSEIAEDIKKKAAWVAGHRLDLRTPAGKQIVDLIEEALSDERARGISALAAKDAEIEKLKAALGTADEAIAYYLRYLDGGETRGSYDGKPERDALRKAGYATHSALKGDAA